MALIAIVFALFPSVNGEETGSRGGSGGGVNEELRTLAVSEEPRLPSLFVYAEGQGRIGRHFAKEFYEPGERVQLSANAAPNYGFKQWDDGSTAREREIIMGTNDQRLIAIFTNTVPLEWRLRTNWSRVMGGEGDYFNSVVDQEDGINVTGSKWNGVAHDYWAAAYDYGGTLRWNTTYGGSDTEDAGAARYELGGRFWMGGNSWSRVSGNKTTQPAPFMGHAWLVHIDYFGKKLREYSIGRLDASPAGATGVGAIFPIEKPGVFVNQEVLFSHVENLIRLGADGRIEWETGLGNGRSVTAIEQGVNGFVVSGTRWDEVRRTSSWAAKVSTTGKVIWNRTFTGPTESMNVGMVRTLQGDFVLGGWRIGSSPESTNTSFGGRDYWVVCINDDGEMLWEKTFGGHQEDTLRVFTAVQEDNGFLLVGSSESSNTGNKESGEAGTWWVRLDAVGNKLGEAMTPRLASRFLAMAKLSVGGFAVAGGGASAVGGGSPNGWVMQMSEEFFPVPQKQNQTISFARVGDRYVGEAPFMLNATASSGLPVEYSVVRGPAMIAGSWVTITNAGEIEVRASQSGNEAFHPALAVSGIFVARVASVPGAVSVSVTTIAGDGVAGNSDSAIGVEGRIGSPDDPAVAADGTIYFPDTANNNIRMLNPDGALGTLAGAGRVGYLDAIGTNALFSFPLAVGVTGNGRVLVADSENDVIRRIDPGSAVVETFSGSGARGYRDASAQEAQYGFPTDLVESRDGLVYVTEFENHTIRKIFPVGSVLTVAGNGSAGSQDGTGTNARFNEPSGIAVGPDGNLYVTEWAGHRVRKVTPQGAVTTIAGNGTPGFVNGTGVVARFRNPSGIASDDEGNLYVSDYGNHAIRRIGPDGSVTTLAGTGSAGFADGDQTLAIFNGPTGIALEPDGSLVVSDSQNHRVRRILVLGVRPEISAAISQSLTPGVAALELEISGEAGTGVRVESSGDLQTWMTVREVILGAAGTASLTGLATGERTFYRVLTEQ